MSSTLRQSIWACALTLSIAAISYWTAQADMEASKQSAFLGKACFDAGGVWNPDWRRVYYCERPDGKAK